MGIRTLENTSLSDLTNAFNAGFEGYFIKLHLTEEQMQERIITESVDLSLSVGMFDNERIVGFILTAIDTVDSVLTANNAGTGVITEYRGQGITYKLYDFLLPILKEKGVQKCVLEVITNNEVAIHLYEKVGYSKHRKLDCYKTSDTNGKIGEIDHQVVDELSKDFTAFCDVTPTWQYSMTAIWKTEHKKVIEIVAGNRVVAIAAFKPANGRVMFFGVDKEYRRKGFGAKLFHIMSKASAVPLSVINVDSSDAGIKAFLEKMGMVYFLSQYEMAMDIK
jgi:ribosomal protein S18 acetylase RimI-like enzyme